MKTLQTLHRSALVCAMAPALSLFAAVAESTPAVTVPAPAPSAPVVKVAPADDSNVAALALPRQVDRTGETALRFTSLFRPFTSDQAALSPDGKYLAYSLREADQLFVVVVEISNPQVARAKVLVGTDETSTPMLADFKERIPAVIRWMRWTSPRRVVVETNTNHPLGSGGDDAVFQNIPGSILAFDADGANAKVLVTPREVPARYKDSAFVPTDRKSRITGGATGGWSVDEPVRDGNPVENQISALNATFDPFTAVTTGDADPNSTPMLLRPRSPRVIDLVPGKDDLVYVGAGASREYQVYRLNAVTGKLDDFYDEKVGEEFALLLDRQGKARIGVPATLRESFPHEYRIEKFGGLSRWKKIDAVFGAAGLAGFSVAPENFGGPRSVPLGFDEDPQVLYFATNVGRDTFGVYGLDTAKEQRTGFAAENPHYDLILPPVMGFLEPSPLVFDRYTHQLVGIRYDAQRRTAAWLRPELTEVQKFLESQFENKAVELLEWSADGKRFLLLARGPADPGSFYVFDREGGKLQLFAQRAPWLDENRVHPTYDFATKGLEGTTLSGNITMPREIRRKPVPVVFVCPSEPWLRTRSEYRTEVQVLASMGFAVVQLNGRGTWGFGSKQREAVRDGWEEKQVEDMIVAIDYLSRRLPLDYKRVGLWGERRGGWLALRALQIRPGRFRGAVVIDPTVDLVNWAEQTEFSDSDPTRQLVLASLGGAARLKDSPLVKQPETVTKPVLALVYPGPRGGARTPEFINTRDLIAKVAKSGTPAELYELDEDYQARLPKARSTAMREVEKFLNATIYDFDVKLDELKQLE